jgi:transposase
MRTALRATFTGDLSLLKEPRRAVRATTLVNRLLDLPGIRVAGVSLEPGVLCAEIKLAARKLRCPVCDYATWSVYDRRPVISRWRHLDFGASKVILTAWLRRLRCPAHGVVTEWAPFARYRSGFTAEFEDVAAFLATRTDKSAIARFLRIDWDTVGRIIERVVDTELDTGRLDDLVTIGVDEISWRKHHKYLTLVSNHATGKIVWGRAGKDTAALDAFFDELGTERAQQIEAASMDMGAAFRKSVAAHAPGAVICIDPFHVVKLVTDAFDKVRRIEWQAMRQIDPVSAKLFKGARWALLKNPENLDEDQAAQLRRFRRRGGTLWAGYKLKEALRAIFHGDLAPGDAPCLLETWCTQAENAGMAPFAKAAGTLRKHLAGINAALERKINNGRHEGINSNVRLIIRRARGFHSAEAALGLVMLTCGPITLHLPWEQSPA